MKAFNNININKPVEKTQDCSIVIQNLNKTSWDIRRSHPKEALNLAQQAREMAVGVNNKEGLAFSYRNSGTAYYLLSQYHAALTDLQKGLTLFIELENEPAQATILRNIGNIYHSLDEDKKAIEHYQNALKITERENDLQGCAYNYGNLGYVYLKLKDYDLAHEYMFKTQHILTEIKDELGLADVLNNIGKVYYELENIESANRYFQQSLNHAKNIKHLRGVANAHTNLGKCFSSTGEKDLSLLNHAEGLLAAEEMGETLLISEIHKNFADAYENFKDDKNALKHFKIYESLKSEVLKTSSQQAIHAIQSQSEWERSEKEKEIYKLRNEELAKAKKELEMLSIVASETENVILILDADGKLEWVNESFVRLNNLDKDGLIRERGETIFEISNNPDIRKIIADCVKDRKPYVYESLNITNDGRQVWESSTLSPIFDKEGNLRKLIIIDTDVTARKLAETMVLQKNKDITDSINYAKRIQKAILVNEENLKVLFHSHFVLFNPKDIVSGDFYWAHQPTEDKVIWTVADCTGHGVPGAFMSMIGNSFLNEIIIENKIIRADEILNRLREKIINSLEQKGSSEKQRDGMDMGLCIWDKSLNTLEYAGANNPCIIIRNSEAIEIKGDKMPIGSYAGELKQFSSTTISLQSEDTIYCFSDGYADQFGGPRGKKFKYKNLKELLLQINSMEMSEQKKKLEAEFNSWKGNLEQIDDVCMIGVRI